MRFAAALSAILMPGAMLAAAAVAQPVPAPTPTLGPQLILLGTGGGPLLRVARAQSASAIVLPEGILLVDAGEGSVERMTEAGFGPDRIKAILITHLHTDHVAALWSLLLHRWVMRAQGQLEIVGPPGTRAMVDALARAGGPIVKASRALGANAPAIASMVTVTECGADPEQRVTLPVFPSLKIAFARNSHLDADQVLDVDPLLIRGRVTAPDDTPIEGATVYIWHSTPDGAYTGFHKGMSSDLYRGRVRSAADGSFQVATTMPVPYTIPDQGPVGGLLSMMGRHSWRPAHVHFKLRADGYRDLTTQTYFAGGKWVDDDCAGGIVDDLIFTPLIEDDQKVLQVDFVLDFAKSAAEAA